MGIRDRREGWIAAARGDYACLLFVHEARSEENLNLFVGTRFSVDLEYFCFSRCVFLSVLLDCKVESFLGFFLGE